MQSILLPLLRCILQCLIWVYTVCKGLSVPVLRIIRVIVVNWTGTKYPRICSGSKDADQHTYLYLTGHRI